MARGVNKVILVGTCGQDPEVRNLSNGNSVTNLSLATSEQWMDKQSGQRQERTEWHRVVLFGKVAEIAGQYLRKGSQCYIEGKLQTRSWDDKDGVKRYTTEIVVDMQGTLQLLGGRPQNQQGGDGYDQGGDPYNQGGGQQQYNQAPRQQAPRPQQQPQRQAPQQQPQQQQPAADFDSFDDDIPF